jgi:hypothetical protein
LSKYVLRESRSRPSLAGLRLLFVLLTFAASAAARSLAVLDFELVDTTLAVGDPGQIERTQQLAPMLREALAARGVELIDIPATTAAAANHGVGYLFDHPELAATLAGSGGADTIAVCRHDRPTALFSYLCIRVVEAARSRVIGDFVVEIKGQFSVTAPRGVARLADDIAATLGVRQ